MTLDEYIGLGDRLTYKGNKCFKASHFDWRAGKPCPFGYLYSSVWIHAKCVRTGRDTKIENGCLVSIADIGRQNEISHITSIRDFIMALEMHEVNETLALDEKRIFDPHANREPVALDETETKVA